MLFFFVPKHYYLSFLPSVSLITSLNKSERYARSFKSKQILGLNIYFPFQSSLVKLFPCLPRVCEKGSIHQDGLGKACIRNCKADYLSNAIFWKFVPCFVCPLSALFIEMEANRLRFGIATRMQLRLEKVAFPRSRFCGSIAELWSSIIFHQMVAAC